MDARPVSCVNGPVSMTQVQEPLPWCQPSVASNADIFIPRYERHTGLGSILGTVSKDTEDTALSSILSVSYIHFQTTFINGICSPVQ